MYIQKKQGETITAMLARNQQFNFRVNADVLAQAKEVAQLRGVSLADMLNQFLEAVVETKNVPLEQSVSRYATREELLADMDDIFSEYDQVFKELVNR